MKYEWLICGGGIHGVHLAAKLIGEAGIPAERIRILDPAEKLLARWHACTEVTGMTHLRSPSVHHLDLKPLALQQFAKHEGRRMTHRFAPPYQRPSLELFNAHCAALITKLDLEALHVRAKAVRCRLVNGGLELTTACGDQWQTKHLILALGSGETFACPEGVPMASPRIQHVFEPGFRWPDLDADSPVLVFGGGISAGQVALRLVAAGHKVHVIARHGIREHQFDSDPGWLGPKNMANFQRESCPVRRRRTIQAARHRGSMPGDVRRALKEQVRQGNLYWHQRTVEAWQEGPEQITVKLSEDMSLSGQYLFLATGFAKVRPGGALVDDMIQHLQLETAPCGFPVVDQALRWHPRIFVSGALAELELGPVARNIAGARRAGDRLLAYLDSLHSARGAAPKMAMRTRRPKAVAQPVLVAG